MVAYVLCFLSLGEETQTEFLAPSFDLVVVGIWKIFLCLLCFCTYTHIRIRKERYSWINSKVVLPGGISGTAAAP